MFVNLEIPHHLLGIIHSSLDMRIRDLNQKLEENPELEDARQVRRLILQARGNLEMQAREQGILLKRIYTED